MITDRWQAYTLSPPLSSPAPRRAEERAQDELTALPMAERFQAALGQISTEMPSIEEAIFADTESTPTGEIGTGDPAEEEAKLDTLEKQLDEQLKVRSQEPSNGTRRMARRRHSPQDNSGKVSISVLMGTRRRSGGGERVEEFGNNTTTPTREDLIKNDCGGEDVSPHGLGEAAPAAAGEAHVSSFYAGAAANCRFDTPEQSRIVEEDYYDADTDTDRGVVDDDDDGGETMGALSPTPSGRSTRSRATTIPATRTPFTPYHGQEDHILPPESVGLPPPTPGGAPSSIPPTPGRPGFVRREVHRDVHREWPRIPPTPRGELMEPPASVDATSQPVTPGGPAGVAEEEDHHHHPRIEEEEVDDDDDEDVVDDGGAAMHGFDEPEEMPEVDMFVYERRFIRARG